MIILIILSLSFGLAGYLLCDHIILKMGFFLPFPSEGEDMHDAHHGLGRDDQQTRASEREEKIQRTGRKVVITSSSGSSSDKALELEKQGLIRINGILGASTASKLLSHVNMRLEQAMRERGDKSKEKILGVMLCGKCRHDLKLDLREDAVLSALNQAVQQVGPPAASLLGQGAELFELGAIVAEPGAKRQPAHPDTPWSAEGPSVLTAFISLQDMDEDMGPTAFLPGTHDQASYHEAYNEQDSSWDAVIQSRSYCSPLLQLGDCVVFDSRLLHYAQECRSKRRVLVYFSLRAMGVGSTWSGCGFDRPGTLLDEHRGKYQLANSSDRLIRRG